MIFDLEGARRREVQAIGAAISTRSWHDAETAYNALRDKMDAVLHQPAPPAALSPQALPAPGEVVEAPENGEPDPEWRAIKRAIDQFVGRVPVISRHRAVHNTMLAETVARLDAAGDREAADTIVWLCWFRALDRERERFLLADAAEKLATVAAANDEGVAKAIEALEGIAQCAEARIQDGQDMGVRIWRIALEDIVTEARAAIRLLSQGEGK